MARRRGQRLGDWSDAELEFLAAAPASGLTMPEAADILGRTYSSVQRQASVQQVRFPRRSIQAGILAPWTEEDDDLVRELIPAFVPYAEVADRLGRSVQAVRTRAYRLGVQGRPRGSWTPKGAEHPWSQSPFVGPDHPRYSGGSWSGYRGEDWAEVRQAMLERDSYTCQQDGCGRYIPSGNGLVVHHVIPYRLRQANDPRWLVTLCVPHHLGRPEHFWKSVPENVEELFPPPIT